MIRIVNILSLALLIFLSKAGWCDTGSLFTISGSGTVATLDITLCLNGKSPQGLTCQNYTVTRLNLSILTVKIGHMYPAAGIKIKTPGYTPSGCSPFSNGYCLFSVSDTKPAVITINSTTAATTLTITNINPTVGPTIGGTGFQLTGTNFIGATGVTFGGVAATSVNVVNSTTVTGVTPAHGVGAVDVEITAPGEIATLTNGYTYQATAVGQSSGGGVIACLNGGLNNLIVAETNAPTQFQWGGLGIDVPTANSITDGATNTASIVSCLTDGIGGGCIGGIDIDTYAAGYCSNYEVDSQGKTPCEAGNTCYTDWFLPALDNATNSGQLNCLYTNRATLEAAGVGLGNLSYWSSTQFTAFLAYLELFTDGSPQFSDKSDPLYIRCVRAFIP